MKITALFFGLTADLVGSRSIDVEFHGDATPNTVLRGIVAEHPALGPHRVLIAVNEEYVSGDTLLRDGDELAIFTAVSGG